MSHPLRTSRMCKMPCLMLFLLFLPYVLCVVGQESVELFTLHDSTSTDPVSSPVAAAIPNEHLMEVSTSVLRAESWTRTHILAHYPAINITTIVVGHNLLCEEGQEHSFSLVLLTVKNIHYALTRWGLQKDIKVSASFSSSCLHPTSGTYREDIAKPHIKPLLSFLKDTDSTYIVNPPSDFAFSYHETMILLNSHLLALKNIGCYNLNKMNVIIKSLKEAKPTSRKLSSIFSEIVYPFPISSAAAPTGSSHPAHTAKGPVPPLLGKISPPPLSLPFPPELPPMINPAAPPYGLHLPPCNPSHGGGPVVAPPIGMRSRLWCVAKPSVPSETLQVALDYACGEGGADCEAITPQGSCYYPNTVIAHASYAFNSYWQKTNRNGGSCGFGGTAMLINSDPSYRHCRFVLT